MGAGLSMASVNKIKELANSREYSLALELVEHQDLSKSLNPQFLRLCGEIYIKNNRYEDARRCLIMAHRLAPESKRIMYVFVELYLRMGYFELAKTYYDMYMFDAGSYDSRQMEYVWTKHEHPHAFKDMEQLLAPYLHNLDYDWSFELYLVYKKEEKKEEAHSLAELYEASFKNSEDSDRIREIEKGSVSADAYFDVYASEEKQDDDERFEELRKEEAELLAADNLRMHPKEAEITVMYEDAFTPAGSEKKVQKMLKKQDREEERKEKKLLKEQKKQEKKLEKQAAKAENSKEEAEQEAAKPEAVETAVAEETKPETVEVAAEVVKPEVVEAAVAEEAKPEAEEEAAVEETKPETEDKAVEEEAKPEAEEEAAVEETKPETEDKAVEEATEEPESEKHKKKGFFGKLFHKKQAEEEEDVAEYAELSENLEAEKEAEPEATNAEPEAETSETIDTMTTGQADDMGHKSKTMAKDVVIVDDDDDFEAEADTIEELAAKENAESDVDKKVEVKKPTFEFQTVELAPDDFEDQFEVDDFSDKLDAEFGEMKSYEPEPKIEEEPEEVEEEPEIKEEPEVVEEPEPEIEEEPEPEIEEEPEVVEEPEIEEEPEPEIEEEPGVVEEPEPEPEIEEEPEEVEEPEPEPEIEEEPEVAEKPETEEPEPEPEIEEKPEIEEEPEFHVAPFTTKPERKKLDFPVFKSSLFPDYHKEVKNVENNFDEIMEEAQDKMTENMRKEAQMQKEAEELLASLGISLDSIPAQEAVKEEQPKQQGPSRDELKASLKIDTNKKNLLKRIKEYR